MARRGITRRTFLASTAATGAVVGGSWLATRKYFRAFRASSRISSPVNRWHSRPMASCSIPISRIRSRAVSFLATLPFVHEADQLPRVEAGSANRQRAQCAANYRSGLAVNPAGAKHARRRVLYSDGISR